MSTETYALLYTVILSSVTCSGVLLHHFYFSLIIFIWKKKALAQLYFLHQINFSARLQKSAASWQTEKCTASQAEL